MDRRISVPLMQVAVVLMDAPSGRFYGYPLSKAARLRSGIVYPLLERLLEDGWVEAEWELPEQSGAKRPRRYYTLTSLGREKLGGIAARAREDERVPNDLGCDVPWGLI